jgi:hypothetical protein
VCSAGLCLLLLLGTAPARADFKYTETSKITGGSVKSLMKFAGVFNKQAGQALKPISSTSYVKGNVLRRDHEDGTIEIIDIDRKMFVQINPQAKTYSETTFDEFRDAMKRAAEQAKQKTQADPKAKDTKVNMNAKVNATPGATGRMVNGYSTNEVKIEIEMEVTAQQQPDGQMAQPQQASGTMLTHVDSWIAPDVKGYAEVTEFHKKLAKELNWTPPSGITVNPQVSQGMQELQKNESLYKGLPILQYVTMSMAGAQGAAGAQGSDTTSTASSGGGVPTSASDAVVKGLGGLFGKKKKKDDAPSADTSSSSSSSNPPPPPSVPGSLMEMTMEMSAFSDAALDAGIFAVPAGFTKVPSDPNRVFGAAPKK